MEYQKKSIDKVCKTMYDLKVKLPSFRPILKYII